MRPVGPRPRDDGRGSCAARRAGPGPILLLAAVAALGGLPGCASGRANLWPLYFREVREVQTPDGPEVVATTEVLYPFFHREARPTERWHALRPIFNYQHGTKKGKYRVQYLWPLGLHARDGGELNHRLFPLFEWNRTWDTDLQKYGLHAHLLQLIRWGDDPQHGGYFAFIPFGGVTHGVIGDTWSFLAFPIYSYFRRGDYVRRDFPWPFIGYASRPDGRTRVYRVWPLFVYRREENRFRVWKRYDVLWPLIRWGSIDTGSRYYHTVLAVAPLFSTIRTYDRADDLVAYQLSVLGITLKRDSREDEEKPEGWGGLWSLLRSQKTSKKDEFRFLPFYWRTVHYKTEQKKPEESWRRTRVPWPVVWLDSDRLTEPGAHHKGLVVAPFWWQYTDVYGLQTGQRRVGRAITLWPLFTHQSDPDGGKHFWMLSHGWHDATGGYKRNYRAFFDIFQYHHRAAVQERETRVVSRLYHHRRGPRGRYLSIASLFTYDSTAEVVGEEGTYVSCLLGLVKWSWSERGTRWRIFYIPFGGS